MKLQQARTWRDLLSQHLGNAMERQRVAYELGVSTVTLQRWIKGESAPRIENLQRLLAVLPQSREILLKQIKEEFPEFSPFEQEDYADEERVIPAEFFARIIHALAVTPKEMRFWSLSNLIVQQALKQLDPRQLGMAITVARCMPPTEDGKVHSLREVLGQGTPPWESDLNKHLSFLGAESLAGYVAIAGHLMANQNLQAEENREPGYQSRWEASAAAAPIMRANAVAGSLLISSTQPDYFTFNRCQLIEQYAELLALVFDSGEFHDVRNILPGAMPPSEAQHEVIDTFRRRVVDMTLQASRNHHPIQTLQAEEIVWRQIEEELLNSSLSDGR
jgi:transcriptional regulator with XRE-family HTH domain